MVSPLILPRIVLPIAKRTEFHQHENKQVFNSPIPSILSVSATVEITKESGRDLLGRFRLPPVTARQFKIRLYG